MHQEKTDNYSKSSSYMLSESYNYMLNQHCPTANVCAIHDHSITKMSKITVESNKITNGFSSNINYPLKIQETEFTGTYK